MPHISSWSPGAAGSLDHVPISRASGQTRLVVRWVEAHNARHLDAMLACAAPDIEFHPLRLFLGAGHVYTGAEGLRLWFSQQKRAQINDTVGLFEVKEAAEHQVVARGSVDLPGLPQAAEFFGTYRFAGGLIAGAYHFISDRPTMETVGMVR